MPVPDRLLVGGAIRIKIVRVVIAVARPVTLRIIFFALALLITLCISGVGFFHLIRLDDGEPDEVF